jgi:hypothetical protein
MLFRLSLLSLASALYPFLMSNAQNTGAAAADLNHIPLSLEANRGQSDANVKFLSHGNGYSLFLTDSGAVLVLSKQESRSHLAGHSLQAGDVIRMELQGAKSKVDVHGVDELPGKANYFIGNDPTKWRAGVSTYARVKYSEVYPGVDLVYYGNQRRLEYDFVVSANADPRVLRLRFAGVRHLSITSAGDLKIEGRHGEIAFEKPVVYQVKDGLREPVEGRYRLLADNTVGFSLGRYDRSRKLVIDPALAYSTYLGGSSATGGNAIAVDAAGDFYIVGGTLSPDFPVTANAFQKVYNGLQPDGDQYLSSAFVTKFNARGSELIYSTYLGGSTAENVGYYFGDGATAIAVDANRNAYVTGYASSYNFPVTSNAYQKVNNANLPYEASWNAFVSKLDPTGSSLIYSTYLGGSGNYVGHESNGYGDTATGIAVDSAGSAYMVGTAASVNFPVTANAFQQQNNAGFNYSLNLFVTKFNPAGSALAYSTYLGGSGSGFSDYGGEGDTSGGIAINPAGDAYVTGTSNSGDFPVTANAYQKTNKAFVDNQCMCEESNAIVTELNSTGSGLIYSTYLGGSTDDGANAIALSAAGNAYVTGFSYSNDFPVTPNAFQKVKKNAFIAEVSAEGSALVYSTFFGGSGQDFLNGIALDAFGSAYVTGTTTSTDFPVTPDAFRKANHAKYDHYAITGNAFLSKLNLAGSSLLYSSYLGGSGNPLGGGDTGNGIAVDWFGDAYITGTTCSTDFPLAGAPFQAKNKGPGCTGFVSKFIVNTVTGTRLVSNANPGKVGATATFTATVTPNMGATVPTGLVVFSRDGAPQVTVPLNGSGQATYSNSSLAAGRYTVTATYLGNATTSGSIANLGQLIIGEPARITVASGTYQTAIEGSPFAMPLVVLAQDARGVPVPGAVVDISGSGLSFSGNPAVTNADGNASVMATPTAIGSLTATATTAGVAAAATFKLTATQP